MSLRLAASTSLRVLVLNGVASAALGLVAVVTARELGPGGRGALVLEVSVAGVSALVCGLGTNTAARYLLVSAADDVTLGNFLGLTAVQALSAAVMATAAGAAIVEAVGADAGAADHVLTGGYAAALLLSIHVSDALHAYGRHVAAVAGLAVAGLASLAGAVAASAAGDPDVTIFLGVLLVSTGAHVAFAVAALALDRAASISHRPWWSPEAVRRLVASGRSGLLLNVSQTLAFRGDRYLIGFLIGPAAVGTYSVAATLSELLRLAPYSLSEIVFRRSAADVAYTRPVHDSVRRRCLAALAVVGAVGAIAAPVVIPLVFGDEFRGAVAPLALLVVAELAMGSFYLDYRWTAGKGRLRPPAQAAVAGLVVVVLADLVLIPSLELVGAAAASVLGYATMAVLARRSMASGHPFSDPGGTPRA